VINATAASLHGESVLLAPACWSEAKIAYDMMYGPEPTEFLKEAAAQHISKTADGLGMLVEQAAEAFLRWRGQRPETEPVLAFIREGMTAHD
jgi:shikimate dehydrogenase